MSVRCRPRRYRAVASAIGVLVLVVGIGVVTTSAGPAPSAYALAGHIESGTPGPDAVTAFGAAVAVPGTTLHSLAAPVVGVAATPDGRGYWVVAADGGIFAYGDAAFEGSAGGIHLNAPVVGMAATPDGGRYWLGGPRGGAGMAPTPDGGGYRLVASDGGVFAFGDAAFEGSMGATPLNEPVVWMAAS